MNEPTNTGYVKVMRSHDYCHFEICLPLPAVDPSLGQFAIQAIDETRKEVAKLVDKAVEQYKIAKNNADLILQDKYTRDREAQRIEELRKEKPNEDDWTPEQKALARALSDGNYRARRSYTYEDQFSEPDYEDENYATDDRDVVF